MNRLIAAESGYLSAGRNFVFLWQKNGQDPGSGGLAREREKREEALFIDFLVRQAASSKYQMNGDARISLTDEVQHISCRTIQNHNYIKISISYIPSAWGTTCQTVNFCQNFNAFCRNLSKREIPGNEIAYLAGFLHSVGGQRRQHADMRFLLMNFRSVPTSFLA